MEDMSDRRIDAAEWKQKESYVLQILLHPVWEFPLNPIYATPPAAPVAAATIPNSRASNITKWNCIFAEHPLGFIADKSDSTAVIMLYKQATESATTKYMKAGECWNFAGNRIAKPGASGISLVWFEVTITMSETKAVKKSKTLKATSINGLQSPLYSCGGADLFNGSSAAVAGENVVS